MKVTLVGANLELDQVFRALDDPSYRPHLSPEPIAAAYARISRSEKTVAQLREDARENVDRARKSNRAIVFDMGHASIAEHATFNFDLEGISRLAIEAVEHSRLASYTERSQRYVLIGSDVVVPEEVCGSPGLHRGFLEAVDVMNRGYRRLVDGLSAHHLRGAGDSGLEREHRREIDTASREDARYLLPLATAGQLGLTLNARSLENMVRRLKGSPLAEVRRIGACLEEEALRVTPSLVRHTDPWQWNARKPMDAVGTGTGTRGASRGRVTLLHVTPAAASVLLAAARFESGAGFASFAGIPHGPVSTSAGGSGCCADPVCGAGDSTVVNRELQALVDAWFEGTGRHAPAPRSFELVDFLFELTCSAACFGQLKRHRMATVLAAPYEPDLPPIVPPSVTEAGLAPEFLSCLDSVRPQLDAMRRSGNVASDYLCANAHCRRVLFKTNLRELVHVARLRLDRHAQWEIRDLVADMCGLVASMLPELEHWLCGKDVFRPRA